MATNGNSALIPKNLIQKLFSKSNFQSAAVFVSEVYVVLKQPTTTPYQSLL